MSNINNKSRMTGQKIRCTMCDGTFDMKHAKPRREKKSDDLYENVWYCPQCDHRYIVYNENHAMIALSVKIDKAKQRLDKKMQSKLQKKYAVMFKEFNEHMHPSKH